MHFCLLDSVIEQAADRIVTIKQVTAAEEYLQDHFPGFPVLPGVFMIEALVQAGRRMLEARPELRSTRLVLGGVRALKYGSFVRPGQTLRVEVSLAKALDDGSFELRGEGIVLSVGHEVTNTSAPVDPAPTAVSGKFTLRPVRL